MFGFTTQGTSPETVANGLDRLGNGLRPNGLMSMMHTAVSQLHRFTAINIEVDTGRTKNSLFTSVSNNGNSVVGMLGTDVRYAPYVRESNHGMQFMDYALDREVPRLVAQMGGKITNVVERSF